MRVLSKNDVERLLPMHGAIDIVQRVFLATGTPVLVEPVRTVVRVPGHEGVLASMPAFLDEGGSGGFGLKTVVVNPGNAARGLETHQGVVITFDDVTGVPSAVIEAGSLTAIRTAAASAVATRALAKARTGRIAVLGTGLQARLHLRAVAAVHDVSSAAVWGRDPHKAEEVASWARQDLGLPVEACTTVRAATHDADVVSTVTSTREPILAAADLRAGAHVNAVGACFPDARELSTDLVERARLVVDRREAARTEAGDLLLAAAELGPVLDRAVELGEVLRGEHAGREADDDITVFESLGFAALDVATGRYLVRQAVARGIGTDLALDAGSGQSR
ncbi:ornithine cyclodeaminase family protein [Amycolatopsis lurida]